MTISLLRLPVLVLDCQTTGANPAQGHLLEIGWCRTSAAQVAEACQVHSCLVALPEGEVWKPRMTSLTGIGPDQMALARPVAEVWRLLDEEVQFLGKTTSDQVPTVIHFARFEEPFLRELYRQENPRGHFPFQFAVPVPACWQKSLTERQAGIDPATLDRLRVLTTELRRLVARGIHFELRLSPHGRLRPEGAARLLRWI